MNKYKFKKIAIVTNSDNNYISYKRRMLPLKRYAANHNVEVVKYEENEKNIDVIIFSTYPKDLKSLRNIYKRNCILIFDRSDFLGQIFNPNTFIKTYDFFKNIIKSILRLKIHEHLITRHIINKSNLLILASEVQASFCVNEFSKPVAVLTDPINSVEYVKSEIIYNNNKEVRLVWEGTEASFLQLGTIINPLKKVYSETKFKLILLTDVFQKKESIDLFNDLKINLDVDHVIWNVDSFKETMMKSDIGLSPIDKTNEFNRSKPFNKLLSYWAFGLTIVCSNIPSYQNIVSKSKGGLLCNSESDWIRNIKLLIKDSKIRDELRINGYNYAWNNHNENKYSAKYLNHINEFF
tara:strand:- start:65 stop:1117 length:1053 start_codon:yes stop_codon:yes gene_type:complete